MYHQGWGWNLEGCLGLGFPITNYFFGSNPEDLPLPTVLSPFCLVLLNISRDQQNAILVIDHI
jgi:hypothetical protein